MSLSSAQKVILAFATLIIGIMLLATISGSISNNTSRITVPSEAIAFKRIVGDVGANITATYYVANIPTTWKIDDCPLGLIQYGNASTAWTETTDYTFDTETGAIMLKSTAAVNDTSVTSNVSYMSYTYCGDDYMNLSWGRTMLTIIPGFFGIALLLVAIGLFFSIAKDNGII